MPDQVIEPLPISDVVFIVNEWGSAPRAACGESGDPYPSVLDAPDGGLRSAARHSDAELTEVADLLHPVFEAPSGFACAERVNTLMNVAGLVSQLEAAEWDVSRVWRTARPGRELLSSALLAVVMQLEDDPDARRLGTCTGAACADVYVDASPGGRRRYCSLICQNRARTRAYRARQAEHAAR
ncbi:CGNR zinc finger domain-containing protein [Agromyces silvae]|uniref:CGNR zinc finger domain-containing protein n=1 Tax=Agromyces silvae TaxID=3388266 RepID=UPI00280A6CEF|nr:CGNR zinc finger domain-containing protein [Agromyces protaetiae]